MNSKIGIPNIEQDQAERLQALASYEILDTPREKDYDDIAGLVSSMCETPIGIVNFVADDRQWFKAEVGMGIRETPLDIAFCRYALSQREPLIVPDATQDIRFVENPLVTGNAQIRFYAGVLLETPDGLPVGTLCVLDRKPRQITPAEVAILQASARKVMQQLEARRRRKASAREKQLLSIVESSPDPILSINSQGRLVEFNGAAETVFGFKRDAVLGQMLALQIVPPEWRGDFENALEKYLLTGSSNLLGKKWAFPAVRADGKRLICEGTIAVTGSETRPIFTGYLRDVTKMREAETERSFENRALRMLIACNESVARIGDEFELLKEICHQAVDIGGYRMAFVGYPQNDEMKSVQPVAHAGREENYLSQITLSWSAGVPEGRGVVGRAIREEVPVVAENIARHPDFAPWRAAALKRGYQGVICLPLRSGSRSLGILTLYSAETHPAKPDEIRHLHELAETVALGVFAIRAREERNHAAA